ncbi:hypothetical protein LZ32DRAFT_670188 [Colletotrichum eremochloae]|nr:hypothetical protein LZ32DRAFT_670188 [Colletotrichum eremochloae]
MQQPLGDSEPKRVMTGCAIIQQQQQHQHCLWSSHAPGWLDVVTRIERINHSINQTILEAVRYIRSLDPEMRKDSRCILNDLIMSEYQKRICASFDQWHKELKGLMANSPNDTRQLPSECDSHLETEMKYWTAMICIGACHFHDESVYDCFKDFFKKIVTLAKSILDSCPESLTSTSSEFHFSKSSYLSLLEFAIFKCRWLDIRYEAWLVLQEIAAQKDRSVYHSRIYTVGKRMIEKEHDVSIEEVTQNNAALFPLPAEEIRVGDYTTDQRFRNLVTVQMVDREGLDRVKRAYTEQILLLCGSCELKNVVEWELPTLHR